MLVLLSPSKQMAFSDKNLSEFSTNPVFQAEAIKIMHSITQIGINDLSVILKCNQDLARKSLQMAYDFCNDNVKEGSAALSYSGVAFKELNAKEWDDEDSLYAQQFLRIGSGVYGILKPFDIIRPYRLDLACKIPLEGESISLQKFWKAKVTNLLLEDLHSADDTLINCSSGETFDMLDLSLLKNIRIIQARFLKRTNAGLKSAPTVFVKKARGALANFIVKNRIKEVSEFNNFNSVNMHYEPLISDSENAIFIYG